MTKLSLLRPLAVAIPMIALLSPGQAARAELGGGTASVRTDQTRMKAQLASAAMGGYIRHALTRDNGGMVHEFTNANGQVFAVTWSGPGKPDLRTLLGRYFTSFQASGSRAAGRRLHAPRRPLQVAQADLQIQTGGHMGWFHGVAYIPSLAPAGFSTASLPEQP